jgi:hypothetical protein
MEMNNIDLKKEFEEYFHELEGFTLRSERFYNSFSAIPNKTALATSMKLWLEAAFIQGARSMAQDTVDTLRDYGTAVAGVNGVYVTQSKAFDIAADNLMTYYTQILSDVE